MPVRTSKAIVARGRTIEGPHPKKPPVSCGVHPDTGKEMVRQETLTYHEGDVIELPDDEIAHLRERGFLKPEHESPAIPVSNVVSNSR